jgi:hypothetical protein
MFFTVPRPKKSLFPKLLDVKAGILRLSEIISKQRNSATAQQQCNSATAHICL